MRDLDWLRDDERAPIEYDSSRKGYKLEDQTWNLPPVVLSQREVFAFSVARKLLQGFRGTPLEGDIESLLDKITESIEGNITLDLESLTEHFTVLGEDHAVQDPEVWAAAARSVNRCEKIRVVYQKFNGDIRKYTLEPYHLVSYHGNWYVLARRPGLCNLATFAISRIRQIEYTDEFFDVDASFDVKEHLRKAFGIASGSQVLRVRLLFTKNVATYIQERIWHPTQKLVKKRNGCVELILETAGWKELVRWILSWQPDVKVLAPKKLRERVDLKMKQGLGLVE